MYGITTMAQKSLHCSCFRELKVAQIFTCKQLVDLQMTQQVVVSKPDLDFGPAKMEGHTFNPSLTGLRCMRPFARIPFVCGCSRGWATTVWMPRSVYWWTESWIATTDYSTLIHRDDFGLNTSMSICIWTRAMQSKGKLLVRLFWCACTGNFQNATVSVYVYNYLLTAAWHDTRQVVRLPIPTKDRSGSLCSEFNPFFLEISTSLHVASHFLENLLTSWTSSDQEQLDAARVLATDFEGTKVRRPATVLHMFAVVSLHHDTNVTPKFDTEPAHDQRCYSNYDHWLSEYNWVESLVESQDLAVKDVKVFISKSRYGNQCIRGGPLATIHFFCAGFPEIIWVVVHPWAAREMLRVPVMNQQLKKLLDGFAKGKNYRAFN